MKTDFYIEFASLANIFSKLDYSSEEWRDWNNIHHLINIIESLDHKDSNSKGGMFCVKIAGDMCEVVMNTQHSLAFGDISDSFDVRQAMSGVQGVFHLAASKHVGIAEKQVRECVKSNIIGTMNLLDSSLNTHRDTSVVSVEPI